MVKRMPELKKADYNDFSVSSDEQTIISMMKNVLEQPPIKDLSVLGKIGFAVALICFLLVIPIVSYVLFSINVDFLN
jgi:hypothetical protein